LMRAGTRTSVVNATAVSLSAIRCPIARFETRVLNFGRFEPPHTARLSAGPPREARASNSGSFKSTHTYTKAPSGISVENLTERAGKPISASAIAARRDRKDPVLRIFVGFHSRDARRMTLARRPESPTKSPGRRRHSLRHAGAVAAFRHSPSELPPWFALVLSSGHCRNGFEPR
jgi:hypothetical protein